MAGCASAGIHHSKTPTPPRPPRATIHRTAVAWFCRAVGIRCCEENCFMGGAVDGLGWSIAPPHGSRRRWLSEGQGHCRGTAGCRGRRVVRSFLWNNDEFEGCFSGDLRFPDGDFRRCHACEPGGNSNPHCHE
jgi:hypothetical protein